MTTAENVANASIDLDRDIFMRSMLRELAGALEDVVGVAEASGYISLVGGAIGEQIHEDYCRALSIDRLSREQVAHVLVDLKRRIQGQFFIVSEDENRIVFGNRACPFGKMVEGRPSLCMMTSNVFGYIAAQSFDYARVEITEAISLGHEGCRIVVHLKPGMSSAFSNREYFRIEK